LISPRSPSSTSFELPRSPPYVTPKDDPRLNERIHRRPKFVDLLRALILDRAPKPLEAAPQPKYRLKERLPQPRQRKLPTSSRSSDAAWYPGMLLDEIKDAANEYYHHLIFGNVAEGERVEETLEFQQKRIRDEVAEWVDEGDDTVEERLQKQRAKERAKKAKGNPLGKLGSALNPLAIALTPVQAALREIIPQVRLVRHLLYWQDRILTAWLALAIILTGIALALVPWGFVIYWTARLGGFIFFGPHMYFVGRVVDKQRKTARDAAETYRWATAQGKQRILDDYRESLMKKAREQVAKALEEQASASEGARDRLAFLQRQKFLFVNLDVPGTPSIKYDFAADPGKSQARPLVVSHAVDDADWEEVRRVVGVQPGSSRMDLV